MVQINFPIEDHIKQMLKIMAHYHGCSESAMMKRLIIDDYKRNKDDYESYKYDRSDDQLKGEFGGLNSQ